MRWLPDRIRSCLAIVIEDTPNLLSRTANRRWCLPMAVRGLPIFGLASSRLGTWSRDQVPNGRGTGRPALCGLREASRDPCKSPGRGRDVPVAPARPMSLPAARGPVSGGCWPWGRLGGTWAGAVHEHRGRTVAWTVGCVRGAGCAWFSPRRRAGESARGSGAGNGRASRPVRESAFLRCGGAALRPVKHRNQQ